MKYKPIVDEYYKWIETIFKPTGKLREAVIYAVNQQVYLRAFLDHGEIEISNNQVENAIRPIVVGRKNWLFCDTPAGACASAMGLCTVGVHGIDNGLIPIVAYNYGASQPHRVREALRWALVYSVLFYLPFLIVLETAPGLVLRLFNASSQMMGIGFPAVRIMGLASLVSIPSLVVASAFQGLSCPGSSMLLTILRQAALPFLLAMALSPFRQLDLIWVAFLLAEGIGNPVAMALWRRESRTTLKNES